MVDFRRWAGLTTPHLFLTALFAAGFAGCRSAQSVISPTGPVRPVAPVESVEPPYEEPLVSPQETAATGTHSQNAFGQAQVNPFAGPDSKSRIRTRAGNAESPPESAEIRRTTENTISTAPPLEASEPEDRPSRVTPPFESEVGPLFESEDDTTRKPVAAALIDLERPDQKSVSTAAEPAPAVSPDAISAPSLPLEKEPGQAAVTGNLHRDQLQILPAGEPAAVPLFSDAPEAARGEDRGGDNVGTADSAAESAAPFLPEATPSAAEAASLSEGQLLSIPELPVTGDRSVQFDGAEFSGADESIVPAPVSDTAGQLESETAGSLPLATGESGTDSSDADQAGQEKNGLPARLDNEQTAVPQFLPGTEETDSQSGLRLPEVASRLTPGDAVPNSSLEESSPFIVELPVITPGPRQPVPPDAGVSLSQVEEPFALPEAVASIVRSDISREKQPEISNSPGVRAVEIASFAGQADGIVFDYTGTAYVSHNDSVSTVTLDGEVVNWARTGGPRGHVILRDGTHLICDVSQRAVLHLDAEGNQIRKVATKSDGHLLRAPNDITVDRSGGFYFTDPGHSRIRNAIGRVHYAASDGTVRAVVENLGFPEGIALTPDGSALFIAESHKNRIVKCDVSAPGKVGAPEVFCVLPQQSRTDTDNFVDGLVVDREGWLYAAHRGMSRVEVIGPDGEWRTSFSCPDTIVSNLAFSHDYSKLFVTGSSREMRGKLMIIDFQGPR